MESALAHLTARPGAFAEQWPEVPEVHHGDPVAATALLGVGDVDRLIGDHGLPASSITMAKDDAMAEPGSLMLPDMTAFPGAAGNLDARRIGERLRTGHTLLLMGLHRTWRPLGRFTRLLSSELGHPLYAHAFLTPPESQGFAHHWDTEAVFIMQTAGHKTWELHAPAFQDPLPRHRWGRIPVPAAERKRFEKGTPFLSIRLSPGDVLWVPRGWIHNGYAESGTSLHVSLGVLQFTRHWALERLLDLAAEDPEFRVALPPGLNERGLDGPVGDTAERFARWLADLDVEQAAQKLRAGQLRAQSGPRRPAVAAAVAASDVDSVTGVPGAVLALTKSDNGVVLHLGDRDLRIPDPAAGAVLRLIDRPGVPLTSGELATTTTPDVARRLLRTLVDEGIAEPAS
ncbi:JmjC domain-containing protein [Actinomadura xylanilytica]|uniref:JmjC domain-containing protein n=1 Tax=Actinomadura xylanilytica TaxID=887459 RepID=UPI00255B3460|nr:cupin domain-containing protein [Actinomadura xylanilytica]MDL4773937.1 cupin domain-containing protein [Actinomadura xylanilytica]